MTFEDTIRLRETEEECKERAMEMVRAIVTIPVPVPPPYTLHFKCEAEPSI